MKRLSIVEEALDTTELISLFKHLKEMRMLFKQLSKNKEMDVYKKHVSTEIEHIKNSIASYSYRVYNVTFTHGTKTHSRQFYHNYPTIDQLKTFREQIFHDIRMTRRAAKDIAVTRSEFAGFRYALTGGVFTEAGTIKEMDNQSNPMSKITRSKKPHAKIKNKYVGIELELIAKAGRETILQKFIDAKLASYVYVKDDSSINAEVSGDRTHEVTILTKEEDLSFVVNSVCRVLNDPEVKGYVNNSCGMHAHIDVRNRDHKLVFNNLVRVLPLMTKLVPATRTGPQGQRYCALNKIADFDTCNQNERYQAVNPDAFSKYKTIEVRLHSGTINAAKIINWCKMLIAVADSEKLTDDIKTVDQFAALFPSISGKLIAYLHKRFTLFSEIKDGADTRSDHFYSNDYEAA